MNDIIIAFPDKEVKPTEVSLSSCIGDTFAFWEIIRKFTIEKYPKSIEEWNYPGKKFGWSFRIKDKKRAIVYLIPKEKHFLTAFVFGQKATDEILRSDLSDFIKDELNNAKVYAEGRGIRIEMRDNSLIEDIKKLIEIKLKY